MTKIALVSFFHSIAQPYLGFKSYDFAFHYFSSVAHLHSPDLLSTPLPLCLFRPHILTIPLSLTRLPLFLHCGHLPRYSSAALTSSNVLCRPRLQRCSRTSVTFVAVLLFVLASPAGYFLVSVTSSLFLLYCHLLCIISTPLPAPLFIRRCHLSGSSSVAASTLLRYFYLTALSVFPLPSSPSIFFRCFLLLHFASVVTTCPTDPLPPSPS